MKDKNSPYRNYYVWADKDSISDQIAKKKITLDSDNIRQWHEVDNDSIAEHYYGFFSSHMPDLNFDNQKVRDEMVDVARFWIEEMKVDGFRFDAARHIYPDDRNYDSHQFWLWYRKELQKIKSDIYMVGEVYSVDQNEVSPYTKGLPALFNFEFGSTVISTINSGKDSIQLVQRYIDQIDFFKSSNPDFLDAPILTNHDQNRVMTQLGDDMQKAKVAASILLTMPGTPYIYYGEELGMRGTKPDEFIREPFLWGDDKVTTRWTEPRFSTSDSVPDLAAQQKDENSLYTHYKNLIEARNFSKALTFGSVEPIKDLPAYVIGLKRKFDMDEVIVFHNISKRNVIIELKDGLELYREIVFGSNGPISVKKGKLAIHPYGTVIFKKKAQ